MDNRINIQRLQPRFQDLLRKFLDEEWKGKTRTALAEKVGVHKSHITNLLKKDKGARTLTATYIEKFIRGGVFTVDDIYDGKPESDREKFFWEKLALSEFGEVAEVFMKARDDGRLEDLCDLAKKFLNIKD